jgi:hypothetical protein
MPMSRPPRPPDEKQRLAAKLRENLARRKAQARARATADQDDTEKPEALKPAPASDSKA